MVESRLAPRGVRGAGVKRPKHHFIAILPASLVLSCGEPGPKRTMNPPPDTKPEPPKDRGPLLPPVSYGPREKIGDGCTVLVSGNPPMHVAVSCDAPIEPPPPGGTFCQVASKEDPAKKVPVQCEEAPK
jgi:hypothetical protein